MEQSRIEESVSVSSSSVDIFVVRSYVAGLTLFFSLVSNLTRCLHCTFLLSHYCALEQQAPRRNGQMDDCKGKAARSVFVPKRRTELLGS
jgi:hypothetical protein